MLRNLRLRTKLLTGFMLVSLVAGLTGYVGVHGSQEIRDSLKITANTDAIQALLEIKASASEIEAQTLGFEPIDEPSREEGSLTGAQKYKLIGSVEQIEKWVDRYDRATRPAQEDQRVDWTQSIWDRQATVVALAFDSLEFKERGISGRQLLEKRDELRQAQEDLRGSIAGALQHELTAIESHILDSEVTSERVIKLNVLIAVAALLVALLLGALLARSISQPITQLTEMVNSVGKTSTKTLGTLMVSSNDEVGQLCKAFEQMTERLKETTVSRDALVKEVTERKRAEEDLAIRADELRRSNADLEQFAYVASHDLQEPLRMVASYTQLLAKRYKGKLDSDAHEFIAYAVDGATRMQELINGLLTYSRVNTRGNSSEPADCSFIFDQVLSSLQVAVQESGAVVTRDDLPTVMDDAVQLGQVFQNLIDNAIKFHGKDPPRIHAFAERKGKEWLFSVRDNGIGIGPQYADRIFLIFQHLHSRTEYSGSGIGLAICKTIVDRRGGRIWVESELGKGATFYFTIPAVNKRTEPSRA